MDACQVIRKRLQDLGLEPDHLATASGVKVSRIAGLLSHLPSTSEQADIYNKISGILKFPPRHLSALANRQRKEQLKRKIPADSGRPPAQGSAQISKAASAGLALGVAGATIL